MYITSPRPRCHISSDCHQMGTTWGFPPSPQTGFSSENPVCVVISSHLPYPGLLLLAVRIKHMNILSNLDTSMYMGTLTLLSRFRFGVSSHIQSNSANGPINSLCHHRIKGHERTSSYKETPFTPSRFRPNHNTAAVIPLPQLVTTFLFPCKIAWVSSSPTALFSSSRI